MSPLVAPPDALDGFPSRLIRPTRRLYRIHQHDRGPWWFSHDGSGRFDLAPPSGTCYLAAEPLGAFIEVFREISFISRASVSARHISVLHVPRPVRLADCTVRQAHAYGVTAALHSSERYDL
ncbi:MAG: RES domain-containing protein, partial [Chloroflexota bacterium]